MQIKNESPLSVALSLGENPDGSAFLAVIAKATLQLKNSGAPARLAAQQRPVLTTDEPYDSKEPVGCLKFESDQVPFKPRTDIVLVGNAHSPFGRPVKALDVEIAVGEVRKRLRVFGDRVWSFASEKAASPVVAGPTEFVAMPLTYDRAFGGIDERAGLRPLDPKFRPWSDANPLGRGFCGARTTESIDRKPLPNVEDPEALVRSWDSCPTPAGCGFFPRSGRPRRNYQGTFDEKWKAERARRLPSDFSFLCFNGADPSLQVSPYLAGNEPVRLTHVSPQSQSLEFRLPSITPLMGVMRRGQLTEFAAHLDTLVFVPDEEIFYQVWRGTVALDASDASDVAEVRVLWEPAPTRSFAQPLISEGRQ